MNINNTCIPLMLIALISGCATTQRLPVIDDHEAFKYERKYLAKNEQLVSNYSPQPVVKWVQPSNKDIPCRTYFGASKNSDLTLDENFKVFWDGGCKNGYANGIGRILARGTLIDLELLAIYEGKQIKPKYFVQIFNLNNVVREGDISNGYFVETRKNENNFNFDIKYIWVFPPRGIG